MHQRRFSVVYAVDVPIDQRQFDDPRSKFRPAPPRKSPKDSDWSSGKNAAVEFKADACPLEADNVILNSLIDKEATNIEQGCRSPRHTPEDNRTDRPTRRDADRRRPSRSS